MSTLYLMSDFGRQDTYVAQMKSAAASAIPPITRIIDLTHDVAPGAVEEGAFHLWAAAQHLQPGSVVVAVVDPGVGTDRMGVVCRGNSILFVGPDNGLFGLLGIEEAWRLPDPPERISTTFHGRDIFAPAGARLIVNPGWVDMLEQLPVEDLVRFDIDSPVVTEESVAVSVAHVDWFGNVVLWLDPLECPDFIPDSVVLPDGRTEGLTPSATYEGGQDLLLITGSQGLLELALDQGSAAAELGLGRGDRVRLARTTP